MKSGLMIMLKGLSLLCNGKIYLGIERKKYIYLILFWCLSHTLFGQNIEYKLSRDCIKDLDTIVTPNGIWENFELKIGGINQFVYTRGKDKNNPVIIFVHGGPSSPLSPAMWLYQRPLEEYFTIVNYDQRGAGKTFLRNDTTIISNTLTIERFADDLIDLTDSIKRRYGKDKVILIAHSWGTIVSMKAILKKPDSFCAYVGIGQVINFRTNEKIGYEFAINEAKKNTDSLAIKELLAIAPYPGEFAENFVRMDIVRKWSRYYGGFSAYRKEPKFFYFASFLSPDYTIDDRQAFNAYLFTLPKIIPALMTVNYTGIKKLTIPIFMFMGRHDYTTPTEPTIKWLNQLNAPLKKAVWFENSAHLIPFEEPGKFLVALINEVRPLAK
jgi:pimeloyl-ACP methyl ester carboxylesterase